jgi:ABC-type branched-subunit amino acid transport system substrate-binding protein
VPSRRTTQGGTVRRSRRIAVVGAVIAAVAVAGALPAFATTPRADEGPKATEVGVSTTTIRIAVIADVDNPIIPGLFQPTVDGVNAAVKLINKDGGIAGRKLAVDFIDSKLNPNETRNAIIKACANNFAMVGTAAIFVTNVDDMTQCKDQAGNATGLPDFGAVVPGNVQACAPTEFSLLPPQVLCDTKDEHPQTYQSYVGAAKFLLKKHGDLHGAYVEGNDSADGYKAYQVQSIALQNAGIKADQEIGVSSRAPQSVYTPIVAKMKQDGSNFGFGGAAPLAFRQEAILQGIPSDSVTWLCNSTCYNEAFEAGGSDVDGQYVTLPFLPFEDANQHKAMATFVKAVGKDKVQANSIYGYAATLAFRDAMKAAVEKGGTNNVTRAALLEGGKTLTHFDADGLFGTENIAEGKLSSCYVLIQIQDGKWKRVNPTKKGTFDCRPSNYVTFEHDFG